MMRNLLKLLFVILILASSCKRDEVELTFGVTPVERMAQLQKQIKDQLTNAEFGWKVLTTTPSKGNFGYYMDFDVNGPDRIRMVADILPTTLSTVKESAYRVKILASPVLSFETYTYIHLLGDPDASVIGGESMYGFRGDVDFEYQRSTPDSIFLIGRKFRNKMIMVKASQVEQAGYLSGGYLTAVNKIKSIFANNLVSLFDINGITYQITPNSGSKMVDVISVVDNAVKRSVQIFSYSIDGLEIPNGLAAGNTLIKKLVLSNDKMYVLTSTGESIEIRSSSTAIVSLNQLMGVTYRGLSVPTNTTYPGTTTSGVTILDQLSSLVRAYPGSYTRSENNLLWDVVNKKITYEAALYNGNLMYPTRYRYDYVFNSVTGVYTLSNMVQTDAGYAGSWAFNVRDFLKDNQFTLDYLFANGNAYGKLTSVSGTKVGTVMTFALY